MRDTRSTEIKKILKNAYPEAQFRVRIHKYSMGESIHVNTDLIKREKVSEEFGVDIIGYSKKATEVLGHIETLLRGYESIDRDQWGDILGGGNTFLFIEEL
jgi:hypothetical protein